MMDEFSPEEDAALQSAADYVQRVTGWRHRVMRHVQSILGTEEVFFGMHEVHFDADDKPVLWTTSAEVQSEDVDGLRETLLAMLDALDEPVLEYGKEDDWPPASEDQNATV
jgi:hypothetical protein